MTRSRDIRVLFVCTANECRSPFAAAIATRRSEGLPIVFESAGVETWRRGVPTVGLQHAAELGLDLKGHVSAPIHPDFLEDYDLVLGLARTHVREIAAAAPDLASRLFTVRQFAAWTGDHPRADDEDVTGWLRREASATARQRLLSSNPSDDVDDPIGRPIEEWRTMTGVLVPAIDRIVSGLFPRPVA